MTIGITLDAAVVFFVAVSDRTGTRSASAAISVDQARLTRRRTSAATLARDRGARRTHVRGLVASLHAVAIQPVVADAVLFALYAKTLINLAAELARGTRDRGAGLAQSGPAARLLPVAEHAVIAIEV